MAKNSVEQMAKAEQDYGVESLQELKGLEAVRKRPGMYIGSTNQMGLQHLVHEIVDNSVDETLAGYNDYIKVSFNPDGGVTVVDHGRGIPIEKRKNSKQTGLEWVLSTLHAGGKFDQSTYKSAGGLHGVGSSVVNALSTKMTAVSVRNGKSLTVCFKDGGMLDMDYPPVYAKADKALHGTTVTFNPDPAVFTTTTFNVPKLLDYFRQTAFLLPDLTIRVDDCRKQVTADDQPKGAPLAETADIEYTPENAMDLSTVGLVKEDGVVQYVFHAPDGLLDYVKYLTNGASIVAEPKLYRDNDQETNIGMDIALGWVFDSNLNIYSFVNNIHTKDGGTHEQGFMQALKRAFNDYARNMKLLKGKNQKLETQELSEGLTAIINLRIPEELLQFEGQTKGKLGTTEAKRAVDQATYTNVMQYLNENEKQAEYLISRMLRSQQLRSKMLKERATLNTKSKKNKGLIDPDKLTEPAGKDHSQWELMIVEGQSASGSAKQGRDRKTQGILALRGKVLNTEVADSTKMLNNKELQTLISTIGTGIKDNYVEKDVRYAKIIIMTDADVDGAHIQALLLTFFYRYMRPLIENGHVYIAQPPLYSVTDKTGAKPVAYCFTLEEVRQIAAKLPKGYDLGRFKGLGEMDAEQLGDTTMDKRNRKLLQVTIADAFATSKQVSDLMGDDTQVKKDWVLKNVNFDIASDEDAIG